MASKTVVELVDDLDGGRADETVNFALDGVSYVIDLSVENATRLRGALAEFVGHASKVAQRRRRAATNGEVEGDERVSNGEATLEINRARKLGEAHSRSANERATAPSATAPRAAQRRRPAVERAADRQPTMAKSPAEPRVEQPSAEQPSVDKLVASPLFSREADATDAPQASAPGTGAALIVPFKTAGQ